MGEGRGEWRRGESEWEKAKGKNERLGKRGVSVRG